MYITDYVDNTKYGQSSVMDFAGYLEKESLVQEQLGNATSRQLSAYLDKQNDSVRVEGREYFFNGRGSTFDCEDVTKAIDANVKGLKKKEARYYTFSLSPSGEEIAHLRRTLPTRGKRSPMPVKSSLRTSKILLCAPISRNMR